VNRRAFITLIGGAAAWPLAGRAQQGGKVYRIGILEPISAARNASNLDRLRKGLRDLGYLEGQNLVIEYRSADGRAERFPDLASELVGLNVDRAHHCCGRAAQECKNVEIAAALLIQHSRRENRRPYWRQTREPLPLAGGQVELSTIARHKSHLSTPAAIS
jgi:hypothetical protein